MDDESGDDDSDGLTIESFITLKRLGHKISDGNVDHEKSCLKMYGTVP